MERHVKKLGLNDIAVLLLIIAKIIFFYFLIGFTSDSLLLGVLTFIYFTVIFYLFIYSNSKYSSRWFLLVYTLLTTLMFADCVYYSYFNQLPSINQIFQMNNLIVVDESIKFTMPPISILLFVDIPIYYMFFKRTRKLISTNKVHHFKSYKKVVVAMLILVILLMAVNPMNADAIKAVNHTEFLSYHMYDFYKNVFGEKDNEIDSTEDVMNVLNNLTEIEPTNIELKGIAEGRNLIVIQVESLQDFPINAFYNEQELMPNLNKLIQEDTLYFDHYYQNIGKGNTSDAEFSTQNSIYPVIRGESYRIYEENTFYGLPWIMRENGYKALAFHGYEGQFWNRESAYPGQGFEDYISLEDFQFTEKISLGLSDTEMFTQTADYLMDLPQPFYSFIITLSNHHPYIMPEAYQIIQLKEEDKNSIFGNYLQGVSYSDMAIGQFLEELKEKGLYENSVIAIYGDHHGLNYKDVNINESMTRYLGYDYNYYEMLNIPLLIHIPGENVTKTISTVGGQVDFLPTISNLLGVDINNKYIFGRDLVNVQEGFVASITYMLRGSFIADNVLFEISREGIFDSSKAWNLETYNPIEIDGLEHYYKKALHLVDTSKYVLDNNLITNEFKNKEVIDK